MITEDYVSFDTAKLLKEKGFDVETEHKMWYVVKEFSTGCPWNSCIYKVGDITREYNDDCCISIPTLQMAMKWLREVHGLFVSIGNDDLDYNWQIFDVKNRTKDLDPTCLTGSYAGYRKYELAAEAAIIYCLEDLI